MHLDNYGQPIYTEADLCDLFMQDPDRVISSALVSEHIVFDEELELERVPDIIKHVPRYGSVADFDTENQSTWFMPDDYIRLDIAKWVLDQCKNDAELQRAGEELLLFNDRDMFMLLRYLKYLVDTMRKHNVVWGVGRGSSVASFVLFLIGIHRINSLYYDLSIDEFLK